MNNNDQRILELKKQIENEKQALNTLETFRPITNCSIEFEGVRQNIRATSKENLLSLMVKLNMHLMSAKDLGVIDEYKISDYSVQDWISDIKFLIDKHSQTQKKAKLKLLEDKLTKLLSEDKKVELEINEIENMLKK